MHGFFQLLYFTVLTHGIRLIQHTDYIQRISVRLLLFISKLLIKFVYKLDKSIFFKKLPPNYGWIICGKTELLLFRNFNSICCCRFYLEVKEYRLLFLLGGLINILFGFYVQFNLQVRETFSIVRFLYHNMWTVTTILTVYLFIVIVTLDLLALFIVILLIIFIVLNWWWWIIVFFRV